MKSFLLLMLPAILLFNSPLHADTQLIRTTVADSSRVVFLAQTPLSWERAEHDSLNFIRFADCPVTDSVGYPELPMITCLVAMPDSVTPELEFSWADLREQKVVPVYPAPAQVLSQEFTTAVVDSFVQDSTAYSSDSFWPAEMVRVIGETRLCGQRLIQVQLFPARYRASDSTLVTVSSISASLSFDSASAVWNTTGLGPYQRVMEDSPIVGYHPVTHSSYPLPDYFPEVDPLQGPPRMPEYLIICASGLYEQCGDAIDDLAEHRVSLNGFDVALVTTDDILEDFRTQSETELDDDMIRDFTEHMYDNWSRPYGNEPQYLLLIGDHEEQSYDDEPWFLPTHEYQYRDADDIPVGNDEWYTYFSQPGSVDNAMPEMFVGRLSVKNGGESAPDTLSTLIYNLIDLEDPVTSIPIPNYRRRIVRLAGTGESIEVDTIPIYHQNFGSDNKPLSPWAEKFTDWLDYDYTSHYCGDGRWFTDLLSDQSAMRSDQWVENCISEFERGAGVVFYTNHGDLHMFSAGLEWCPWYYNFDDTKGCRDSTFNNYQIEQNLTGTVQGYSAPFNLLLCCSAGTFNHTLYDHINRPSDRYFCYHDDAGTTMPYNFSSDCLAERILKNTSVPAAGVFCGSQPSNMGYYLYYGTGILEAIYARGHGRLGDAIASARLQHDGHFVTQMGGYAQELGQFNLLGDPALDISDRVRYPNSCDLSVYLGEFNISLYPEETSSGVELPISFKVRNNGAQTSDECDVRLTLSSGTTVSIHNFTCNPITRGGYRDFNYTWPCPSWFQPPLDLTVGVEVDVNDECTDSWRGNNTGSTVVSFNDTYPVQNGWITDIEEVVSTTPALVNIDNDSDLEIVVLEGNSLAAYDPDGSTIWRLTGEGFTCGCQLMATDLTGDGKSEIVLGSDEGVKVMDPDGDVVQTIQIDSAYFCVGEMESTQGLELCVSVGNTLYLYTWSYALERFVSNDSKQLSFSPTPTSYAVASSDLSGNSYEDMIYCCGYSSGSAPPSGYNALVVYDWETGVTPYVKTRNDVGREVTPASGLLDSEGMVGWPCGSYDPRINPPALVIEPGVLEESCEAGDCEALNLIYGVYADWDPSPSSPGADTFILPSEMQALAWNNIGQSFGSWPTDIYSDAELGSPISPTTLGNIDNTGFADVLFSTELDGKCTILAFDSDAEYSAGFDVPLVLPDDVSSYGGFAIADIDRDGTMELVFSTSDCKLHCWELGSCSTGYAPWPQFQHDDGRTGVLE